jgi:UDP-GlcNAc3NAcA epimerase
MSKKFLTILGARPQIIKFDPELKNQVVCYTGQHFSESMKDVFFKGLNLPKPDYDLGETTLGGMTNGIMEVIEKEKPHYVIVYGDTRSTLAGAIASLYKNVPLIHIEAGCRSFNDKMPEERIRTLVDDVAIIHFAPSLSAKEYLERDNKNVSVYNVGATQIDAMHINCFPTTKPEDAGKYVVATIHRESNANVESLQAIMDGFGKSSKNIRLYAHPRTTELLKAINVPKNVEIKDPIPYKEMINEVAFAEKVITDSGGLQVEAFYLRVPCITLRLETEWMETVDQGWNVLVGTDSNKIARELDSSKPRAGGNQYEFGGGDARRKIRLILESL